MKKYEYIRLFVDPGDLSELNSLGSVGWRVVGVMQTGNAGTTIFNCVLLEREIGV